MRHGRSSALVVLAASLVAACAAWEEDVERGGHRFERYRQNDAGVRIGMLAENAVVDGVVCKAGGWAHFNADWTLRACFLAEPFVMPETTIPAGAWLIRRAPDRVIVAFEQDTPCQGYVCRGTGGAKGVSTAFYLDGRLAAFFPPEDVRIGDVTCRATPFANVQLHEDGRLKRCTLAEPATIDGVSLAEGASIVLTPEGGLVSP